jgi:hypothetical protein
LNQQVANGKLVYIGAFPGAKGDVSGVFPGCAKPVVTENALVSGFCVNRRRFATL